MAADLVPPQALLLMPPSAGAHRALYLQCSSGGFQSPDPTAPARAHVPSGGCGQLDQNRSQGARAPQRRHVSTCCPVVLQPNRVIVIWALTGQTTPEIPQSCETSPNLHARQPVRGHSSPPHLPLHYESSIRMAAVSLAVVLALVPLSLIITTVANAQPVSYAKRDLHRIERKHSGGLHRYGAAHAHISVVGGKIAEQGTFPWLAYVVDFMGKEEVGECSGTVVAPNLVLTAAHCAEDDETGETRNPSGYLVYTGSINWAAPEAEVSNVSRVLVYPHYERRGILKGWGDAALLELSTPTRAPAIKLASSVIWKPGASAMIAGWGETYYGEEAATEQLRWADTVVQGRAWCNANAEGFMPLGQICAIDAPSHEASICLGDSGGPLLERHPGTEAPVEIGVTVATYGECSKTLPDLFTRSDLIAGWVNARVAELGSSFPTMTESQAGAYVGRALTEVFGTRFKHRRGSTMACEPITASKQKCGLHWSHGPNDYYGLVTVYYLLASIHR